MKKDYYKQLFKVVAKFSIYGFLGFLVTVNFVVASDSNAQYKSVKDVFLELGFENASLDEVFMEIESVTDYEFTFHENNDFLSETISIKKGKMTVESLLLKISEEKKLQFQQVNNNIGVKKLEAKENVRVQVSIEQQTISGKVTDESGEALPGATIQEKGTTNGTITDVDGNFSLNVPQDVTLTVSFVGYQTQEVSVNGRTVIDIQMSVDSEQLDEVVVIGYGEVKKRDLTGSVASVEGDVVDAYPVTTIGQALQGRVTGVHVIQSNGQPGEPLQIRIRGTNSIKGNNGPLWIIDGFPSDPNLLNTSDIESIEVLKDASATAIYGSRGANGVIMVTTKKGSPGETRVEYSGSYTSQSLIRKLPLMNAEEYMLKTNIQQLNDEGAEYFSQADINAAGEGIDWQDLMYKSAPLHKHTVTVSGGSEKTKFSVGSSYFDQEGIIADNSGFRRIALRANVNHDISDIFNITTGIILNRLENNRKGDDWTEYGIYGMFSDILTAPPTLTPYNDDGTYRLLRTQYPFIQDGQANPLMWAKEIRNRSVSNNVMANLALTIRPLEGLSFRISGNITNSDSRTDDYTPTTYIGSTGAAGINSGQSITLNSYNIVTYSKAIGDHSFTFTGAMTYEENTTTSLGASGTGFISDVYETYNIGAASSINAPFSNYIKWTLLSYLGRVNYSFNDRYLVTASFRADGSSRYSEGNKWGYFPSGAVAWRISDESFMDNASFISDLKLRIGYGETGSTAISPYTTVRNLSSGRTVFNKEQSYVYFAPSSTYPGDLKWETTAQTDIGIDAGFFNNRLGLTIDYYVKKTRDLLNDVQLPRSAGYSRTVRNIGSMENKGMEFLVDANILDSELKWNISANISFNQNKVIELYDGQDIFGASLGNTGNVNVVREGESISLFYGYLEDGYDDMGAVQYIDMNGDDVISDDDKAIIGDPLPNFIYGFNSSLSFKNFDFSFYIQGSQGNDIYSQSMYFLNSYFGYGSNMFREVLEDHWTPENPDAKYPRITQSNFVAQRLSDRFVYDGSYLRLKNIQIGYNIPVRALNIEWIRSGQIYVSGQNLLTITSYPWYDPDVNNFGGGSSLNQGIDAFSYPTTKSYTVGLKLVF